VRLFIAVDLDDDSRAAIEHEQKRIASAIDRGEKALAWVAVDRMHLTLMFLGEVLDAAAAPMIDAMSRDVSQPAFDAVLDGIGVFPPDSARKPPRVLWLAVTRGADRIISVQREIAARMDGLGAAIEDRAFHPHLTLARWRRSNWSDRGRVADAARPGAIADIRIDHVTLYQSRLSSAGPSYTPLARANLLRS
jgi:2'-5' RNA ligase